MGSIQSPEYNQSPNKEFKDSEPSQRPAQQPRQTYLNQPPSDPGLPLNILSIVFIFFFPPLGIAVGIIGRSRSKKGGYSGELGLVGSIINTAFTLIFLLVIVIYIVLLLTAFKSKGTVPNVSSNSALPYSVNETNKATVERLDRYAAHFNRELNAPTWLESKGVFADKTSKIWCRFAKGVTRDVCNPTKENMSDKLLLETLSISDRSDPSAKEPYLFYRNETEAYDYSYYTSPSRTTFELTNNDAPQKYFTLPQRPGATLITGEFGIYITHPSYAVTNNQYFGPLTEQSAHEDLMRYLESADSLKSHSLQKISSTLDAALQELWKSDSGFKQRYNCRSAFGEGSVCDYKEFSEPDKHIIEESIQDKTNQIITYLNNNYQEMYRQLVVATRYDTCPKCINGE